MDKSDSIAANARQLLSDLRMMQCSHENAETRKEWFEDADMRWARTYWRCIECGESRRYELPEDVEWINASN